jgi:hypothetical protein
MQGEQELDWGFERRAFEYLHPYLDETIKELSSE